VVTSPTAVDAYLASLETGDTTQQTSSPVTETAVDRYLATTTQQAQPTAPVQSTMDNLVKNKDWLGNAKTIYKHEKGEDYKGSDKDLDYWFRNRHSRFGNDLTNLGMTAYDAAELMDDDVKYAWVNSLDTWEICMG